jgi:hypothetical protein
MQQEASRKLKRSVRLKKERTVEEKDHSGQEVKLDPNPKRTEKFLL